MPGPYPRHESFSAAWLVRGLRGEWPRVILIEKGTEVETACGIWLKSNQKAVFLQGRRLTQGLCVDGVCAMLDQATRRSARCERATATSIPISGSR
jgi:hypothetical protein